MAFAWPALRIASTWVDEDSLSRTLSSMDSLLSPVIVPGRPRERLVNQYCNEEGVNEEAGDIPNGVRLIKKE